MTHEETWEAVDTYFEGLLAPLDSALKEALADVAGTSMPGASVSPNQGKLLHVLVRSHNVRSILEIGTLGGYSTIWMARALPPGGRLVTLELDPGNATIAQTNLERAGVAEVVEIVLGPAITSLPRLVEDGKGPFDLVFIDADKVSTPDYLTWAMKLVRPGSVIIIDNVVRKGQVANAASTDENVKGVQRAIEMFSEDPRLMGAAIQTVGSKGYDGFAIAVVVGE